MSHELLIQTVGGADSPHLSIEPNYLKYGYRLNAPGPLEFRVQDTHDEVDSTTIAVREHEALIRRDSKDVKVGPILTLSEGTDGMLTFGGVGALWYLKGMHVTSDLSYSSTDQFAILRGYIQHHLNKSGSAKFNLNLASTETSGITRDRTLWSWEEHNVYDLMQDFTKLQDGFDVSFDAATRTIHMHYPRKGKRRENAKFEDVQIRDFSRELTGDEVVSEVLGTGQGDKENTLTDRLGDSAAKATYGLFQSRYVNKDVKVASTLRSHLHQELKTFTRIPNIISFTAGTSEPALGTYFAGDEVHIKYASRYQSIDEYQHLVGYDVVVERGREDRVVLYLNPL